MLTDMAYIIIQKVTMRLKLILLSLLIASAAVAGEKAVVKRISDGDTIIVNINGAKVKVRLIGIDTPEKSGNSKATRTSKRSGKDVESIISNGKQAAAFLKSILHKGDTVVIEYDIDRLDKYGRTLAYVYLSDGRMLNDVIISSGYASPLTIPPNVKYKDLFLKSYQKARKDKIGLWSKE